MQFNSYVFILLFLPLFVIAYHVANRISIKLGQCIIIIAGLIFYVYGAKAASWVFAVSMAVNYIAAVCVAKWRRFGKAVLTADIVANVLLLLYYKYFDFLVSSVNTVFQRSFTLHSIVLPLGISFFTFQQIMYVVYVYKRETTGGILGYLSYILYFPKLIMGPLMEPEAFFHQLHEENLRHVDGGNVASGVKLFSYGLFKKLILADTFSKAVAWGFSNYEATTAGDMFLVMLFYTFEIYFDFSGYSDMAVGISQMVNITLPMNFDSPYMALSIRDFWKRWHKSLTAFFTKYVYIPLGGNRKGTARTYLNILIVFLLSGLWHGANWTFVLWGAIYGVLLIVERCFKTYFDRLHASVSWCGSFLVINLLWLLFRSETIQQWGSSLRKMFSFQNMAVSDGLLNAFKLPENSFLLDILHLTNVNASVRGFGALTFSVVAFAVCLVPNNNYNNRKKLGVVSIAACTIALVWGILCLSSESVFVYFNF